VADLTSTTPSAWALISCEPEMKIKRADHHHELVMSCHYQLSRVSIRGG
jgi:hypothetical protein